MNARRLSLSHGSGFSVTELLVSVGIVVVLASLCMGGLRKAQSGAAGAKCTANLRAMGGAAGSYLQDRNGALFPGKFFYTASFESEGGFRDYLGYDFPAKTSQAPARFFADTIFTCPELKQKTREKYNPPALFNRNYTMNEFAIIAEDGVEKSDAYPKRLSRVPSVSGMMLLMDGSATETGKSFHTALNPSYVTREFLYYPHQRAQNVLFLDGHVERVAEENIRKPANPRKFWGNLDLPES